MGVPRVGFARLITLVVGRRPLADKGRPIRYPALAVFAHQKAIRNIRFEPFHPGSRRLDLGPQGQIQIYRQQIALAVGKEDEWQKTKAEKRQYK